MKAKTKKRLTVLGIVLGSIAAIWLVLALVPRTANYTAKNNMMKEGEMPILIAHGGGNKEFPDNTLEAFYNAYSVDQNVMMETDVSITKDGVVILSHDTTLDRKTNVTGAISDWNYADLMEQKVNFGYTNKTDDNDAFVGEGDEDRVKFKNKEGVEVKPTDVSYPEGVTPRDEEVYLATTLEELIVSFPNNRINVEIKQSGDEGKRALSAILALIQKHDAFDRVVLASFHDEIYNEYCRLQAENEVPDCFMYSPGIGGAAKFFVLQLLGLDLFFGDGVCVFQLPTEQYGLSLATEGLVARAHQHNLAVHYWTINDPEEMKYLISIGADGIMTDYPHLLKQVYEEYNAE